MMFTHKKCNFYPCHKNIKNINCLFCYCPLYNINCRKYGGNPIYILRTTKDCSQCIFPHQEIHYRKIIGILKLEKLKRQQQ